MLHKATATGSARARLVLRVREPNGNVVRLIYPGRIE
jgi:hypothetical protein